MNETLVINKNGNGYRTISVRLKEETISELDELAQELNRSRSKMISNLINFALAYYEVPDD